MHWVSLIPESVTRTGEGSQNVTPQQMSSWTNINMDNVQDLLNKAATASPLADHRKEWVQQNKQRLQEVTEIIQHIKHDLFCAG